MDCVNHSEFFALAHPDGSDDEEIAQLDDPSGCKSSN